MRQLFYRIASLVALLFVMTVASLYVSSFVAERARFREDAQNSIGNSYPGSQSITGPIFKVDIEERYTEEKFEGSGKTLKKTRVPSVKVYERYLLPDDLNINQQQDMNERKRGIFKIPTYQSSVGVSGTVSLPVAKEIPTTEKDGVIVIRPTVTILLAVSDARGLGKITGSLAADSLQLSPSIDRTALGPTAKLSYVTGDYEALAKNRQPFSLNLELAGTGSSFFMPIGRQTTIDFKTNWPHPSFVGAVLPTKTEKLATGYSAHWQINSISTEAPANILNLLNKSAGSQTRQTAVGVQLIDPVDIYTLNGRASKYAMLFVLVILGAFVLFELFKQLAIHPLQYLMIGLAIVIFFLLLLSLSEHIGFKLAYVIAAAACTMLITTYAAFVLNSWRRALPLGIGIVALYGALHQILQSEENALLMGTTLLFTVLAGTMIATRKTNWYALMSRQTSSNKGT
jgi:inner membrane protein